MMKKLLVIIFLTAASLFFLSGCFCEKGSGNVVFEKRSVPLYRSVELRGTGDIIITQNDSRRLVIEAEDNAMDHIETFVTDDVLVIQRKIDCFKGSSPIKYHVAMDEVKKLSLAGSGNIISTGKIETAKIDLVLSGSGDIKVDMDVGNLSTTIAGSGDVELSGHAGTHDYNLAGSGNLNAFDLETENTKIGISGSGRSEVFAKNMLDIIISGSGDVKYKGTPQVTQTISGSGSVSSVE